MKPAENLGIFRLVSPLGLCGFVPKSTDISLSQLRFWYRPQCMFAFAWATEPKTMYARQRWGSKSLCTEISWQRHRGRTVVSLHFFPLTTDTNSTRWIYLIRHPSSSLNHFQLLLVLHTCRNLSGSNEIPLYTAEVMEC